MPYYRRLGQLPRKRHIAHRTTPGFRNEGIFYEEVVTRAGFSRAYAILYHRRPPTRVIHVTTEAEWPTHPLPRHLLRHHHLRTGQLPPQGDPIRGRVPILTNADVTLWRCRPVLPQTTLYRNAQADEIIFVHRGHGELHSPYGRLPFRDLDYIIIPRGTIWRMQLDQTPTDLLIIESRGAVGFPERYLNPDGQFKLGAPLCERDLHGPVELLDHGDASADRETVVLVKDGDQLSRYTLADDPFDVVGWDGYLYPFTFNALDFEPITGTVHQPPPIHQTFEAEGFVVCTFAPRMLDTHPEAIKVPYAHSNVDCDEVLYYVLGRFGSRRGVDEASITLHPHGIPHGPHPGTIAASRELVRTDELAVMVDTFRPLQLTRAAMDYDDPNYPYSWLD